MQIISPDKTSSAAFHISAGKQVTLYAKGLTGNDTVVVEILELSGAPDFTGNPCCDIQKARIEVVRRVPLLCPNGSAVQLTAAHPWGVLDSPQGVPLGVRLVADPAALVTVELYESTSTSCMSCICDRKDTVVTYCPSRRITCDGAPGYGYHLMDPKDPAATVELTDCTGTMEPIYIYPTAGPGHTIRYSLCDGTLIGYAANRSDCAPDCGCPKDPVVNITLPAPNVVAAKFNGPDLTITRSDGTTIEAQIPTC